MNLYPIQFMFRRENVSQDSEKGREHIMNILRILLD